MNDFPHLHLNLLTWVPLYSQFLSGFACFALQKGHWITDIDKNQICDEIDQFALSGYRFLNDFSHLGYFRRSGFPTGRSSSSTGVGITINIG